MWEKPDKMETKKLLKMINTLSKGLKTIDSQYFQAL